MSEQPSASPSQPNVSRTRVMWWGLAALAVVVVLSAFIGWIGAGHHAAFDWELASVAGTAIGTTVLAGATGALAWTTWSDVRASWVLVEEARGDRAERDRPLMAVDSLTVSSHIGPDGTPVVTPNVQLRNVGNGPALGISALFVYAGNVVEMQPLRVGALMVGERWGGGATFAVPALPADPFRADEVTVLMRYFARDRAKEIETVDS